LLKDFQSFINEAISLKKQGDRGEHYLDRAKLRLSQLEVIGFIDAKGNPVDYTDRDISETQKFFRAALSMLADPERSRVFSDTTIQPGYIGIVRLGKPKVVLSSGKTALPVFKVYKRTDYTTNKTIFQTGTCFWIFVVDSQVSTIKLYNVDGTQPSDKSFLINKSIDHLLAEREAELARISRVYSIDIDSKQDLVKMHQVVVAPADVSAIQLDLSSGDEQTQLSDFMLGAAVPKKETVYIDTDLNRGSSFNFETVPKQMNVTPDKVWLLERNEKFNTWGAMPILQSRQVTGLNGNEIQIKVGKKWLHWLEKPSFNTPLQVDRVIRKGDTVALAKEVGGGDWLVNVGVVTEIATDSRSSEFPYVKTKGWDSSSIISAENAKEIFVDSRQLGESLKPVLSFAEWINESATI
jgi:hypothetical protein